MDISLFINLNDVIERNSTNRAAFTPLCTGNARKVMAARNEGGIALFIVANLTGLRRIDGQLFIWLSGCCTATDSCTQASPAYYGSAISLRPMSLARVISRIIV